MSELEIGNNFEDCLKNHEFAVEYSREANEDIKRLLSLLAQEKAAHEATRAEMEKLRQYAALCEGKICDMEDDQDALRAALEKIADPRKRDHKEPDAQTEVYCLMHIANEALGKGDK